MPIIVPRSTIFDFYLLLFLGSVNSLGFLKLLFVLVVLLLSALTMPITYVVFLLCLDKIRHVLTYIRCVAGISFSFTVMFNLIDATLYDLKEKMKLPTTEKRLLKLNNTK